ncbi:uncharacterized protein LOC144927721 isoform X2 [Branchiostoma floridae x Branchiostoma belcheri]
MSRACPNRHNTADVDAAIACKGEKGGTQQGWLWCSLDVHQNVHTSLLPTHRETREVRRIPRAERKTRGALMKLCPISPHGRPLLHMQADNLRFSLPWQRTTGGPLRGRLPGHMTHSVIT